MKLACQDNLIPGTSVAEKLQNLENWGFEGVEFWGATILERFDEVKQALKNSSVKPSSVCGGYRGWLIAQDLEEQRQAVQDIKKLLVYCAELEVTGLIAPTIYGSSDFLPQPKRLRTTEEDRKILLESLVEIGECAKELGTTLLLEPLNRYETHLINSLDEGVSLLREVNSPGVKLMGDFFHMHIEEAHLGNSIRQSKGYLQHIHLADSNRHWPGLGHTDFSVGFQALKDIGFDKFMAVECRKIGDPAVELPKAAKYLRQFI